MIGYLNPINYCDINSFETKLSNIDYKSVLKDVIITVKVAETHYRGMYVEVWEVVLTTKLLPSFFFIGMFLFQKSPRCYSDQHFY